MANTHGTENIDDQKSTRKQSKIWKYFEKSVTENKSFIDVKPHVVTSISSTQQNQLIPFQLTFSFQLAYDMEVYKKKDEMK